MKIKHGIMTSSGASAVELALVSPILILMIGSIFTISMALRAQNTVNTYAREAARGVAIGYMTVTEARQFAKAHAEDDLSVGVTTDIDPPTKGDANDRDVVVTVSISRDEMAKLTPFGNLVLGGITAKVVMRSLAE